MLDTSHFHPMLVHFPIALTLTGLGLELFRVFFGKTEAKLPSGELLLYIAAATAVLALLSGFLFTSALAGKPLEVRNTHVLLAILATSALSLASLFYLLDRFGKRKRSAYPMIGLSLYAMATILMAAAGHMGGTLVYTYMIGL